MRGDGGGPANGRGVHPISVRLGEPRDASTAASLHARLINEGFLSSLGARFLGRLYSRITRAEGSFLLIAQAQQSTVGFIAGSVSVSRLYRSFLLRDGVAAFLGAPVRLVLSSPRVLETLRHGRGDEVIEGGELLAVAVDPTWRGQHVGGQLVDAFLREIEERGLSAAHVVVGAENAAAIAMYRRAGFAPARTFELHRGTQSLVMQTVVPSRAAPNARPGS